MREGGEVRDEGKKRELGWGTRRGKTRHTRDSREVHLQRRAGGITGSCQGATESTIR